MKRNIITVIIVSLMVLSCGKNTRHIRIGESASFSTECIGTYDEATLDAIVKYSEEHNDSMVRYLIDSGDAVVLRKGMGCIVRHARIGKVQVELLSGKQVWVLYKHIQ